MSDDRVIVEITLPAPADAVWRALREPAEVVHWFGWDHDALDDEVRQIFVDGAVADEATMTITWADGDRFALLHTGDATILRVTRPAPAGGASWDDVYDEITEGWIAFVQQLRFALARHPGQDRRTIFLGGHAAAPGGDPLGAVLPGLRAGDGAPTGTAAARPGAPGTRYAARAATGAQLTGTVWHTAVHQTGLTVDGYGDGLLVVSGYDATARPPHGGADVIITTYGLDDAAFAELDRAWRTWWDDTFTAGAA